MNKKTISYLASPKIFFYSLITMMIILIIGTIAQKYIGLYIAQNIFFNSFVIWIGFIPLPGMSLISTIIIVNIFFKIFFSSPFKKEKLGIIITHIGIFVLLLGSAITGYFSSEGNIVIKEGGSNNRIDSYHERELLIYKVNNGRNGKKNTNSKDTRELLLSFPYDNIKNNAIISDLKLPVSLKILNNYANSRVILDNENNNIILEKMLPNKENEANIWGMEIEIINNKNDNQNKSKNKDNDKKTAVKFIITEGMTSLPVFSFKGQRYTIQLAKTHSLLPFEIYLEKFNKEVHPGTMMARSYSSQVVLKDKKNNLEWRGLISMNSPLRYKGYTFFQSSFFSDGKSNSTVLAVVENKGRLFPYISSIIICIGLLLHLFVRNKKVKLEVKNNEIQS